MADDAEGSASDWTVLSTFEVKGRSGRR